ncbi:unnamed protein product [Sphagnum troendelagicum]
MECPPTLESYGVENVQLAPEREHQRIKAALAVALCISWACRSPPSDRIHQLQQVTFPSPIGHVLQRSCVLAKKGSSLKWKSNGTHCIEASSDVDDKEWNSRDIDQKSQLSHHNKKGFPLSFEFVSNPDWAGAGLEQVLFVQLHAKIVVPSFRAASLGVPGLVETASYDMLDTENDFHDYDLSILEDWMQTNLRSSIAAVSHEERHAAHIELLSELKNSTGSGGQQEGCIVGS